MNFDMQHSGNRMENVVLQYATWGNRMENCMNYNMQHGVYEW